MKTSQKVLGRERRHKRLRRKVFGTASRPRLSVTRSLKHIYAQVIDDFSGKTLVSSSSLVLPEGGARSKTDVAKAVGEQLAQLAKAAHVEQVVFDRGGYRYHGRVKALAEAVRSGGIIF